jgi:hypothetical protein
MAIDDVQSQGQEIQGPRFRLVLQQSEDKLASPFPEQ